MLKRILLISLTVLATCLIALGTAYLAIDDATLVSWAEKRLADASDIEISSQEPIRLTRTLSPTLTAHGLLIRDPKKGFRAEVSQFDLQISLPALLLGKLDIRQLHIGKTRVVTTKTDAETDQTDLITLLREMDALPLQPVLHNLDIEQITLVQEGQEEQLPELKIGQLAFRHATDKNVSMVLNGLKIDDQLLDFEAEFPPLHRIVQDNKAPFTATLRYHGVELQSQGQVDLTAKPATLSATLQLNAAKLDQLPTGSANLVIPGALTASAELSGTTEKLQMQDLRANWQGPNQSSIDLQGRIGNILQLEQAALQLNAKLVKQDWFLPLLSEDMRNTHKLELTTHISGSAERLVFDEFRLSTLSTEGLAQNVAGKMELDHARTQPELINIDMKHKFSAPTTIAARMMLFPNVPEFGKINGRARVHSTRGAPSLDDIEVTTRDEKGIRVKLTGRIASFPLESYLTNDGYDLTVHIGAANTQLIAERMDLDIRLDDLFSADFRIEGSTKALRLEKIALTTGTRKKVQLQADGYLHFGSWERADPVTDMHLDLRLVSQDTPALAKLLRQPSLPKLGPLQAKAQLRSQAGKHRIENIVVSTAGAAPLSAEVTGSAAKLLILPEFGIDGIRLDADAQTDDVSHLQSVLGTDYEVPAIGPLQASVSITGSSEALSIDKLSVEAGDRLILHIQVQGTLGRVAEADDWHLQDTDITLEASAPGSQAFADAFGYQIPELGPISARATIDDKDKTLGVETASLTVGDRDKPAIRVEGGIDSFLDAGTTHWDIDLDINGHDLAAMTGDETLPDLGDLRGNAIISDIDGQPGIDSLEIRSNKPDLLTIDIGGTFKNFDDLKTLSFNSKMTARDLKLLGSLIRIDLPPIGPVGWNTRIRHDSKNLILTSSLTADKTSIDANILGMLTATPPLFKGTIKADNMFIGDYVEQLTQSGKQRRKEKRKQKKKEKKKKAKGDSAPAPIFSRAPLNINWMRKVDLDIDIKAASFDEKYALADSGATRVVLKSGKLAIDPFRFVYGKESLDISLLLDANDIPSLTFKAFAEDLNPWKHLDPEHRKTGSSPNVGIDIDINASGNSEHDMASSVKGKGIITMEDGQISRNMMNLVFVDIIGWATTSVSRDKSEKINCGVTDVVIDEGIVTTRAFLLDTDDITITGEGTIDLGKETIDYVMLPKKKSRIIARAEPVKITGDLDDPRITALPLKSAAANYGSLIFGPVVFAGVFASQEILGRLNKARNRNKESACEKYKETYEARIAAASDPGQAASPQNEPPTRQ